MSPIWMETMAAMVRIILFQWTEWLTDASVGVNPSAFKFLHEIFVDTEYGSQLFRVQLRPHDNPIVQIISSPYRWMTLLSKLRFLVLGLLKDCSGISCMRFMLMRSILGPNYLGASYVLVTVPRSP